ncbi:MAG: periplasmic heavy metal sensor [Halioglobus sp.]|nr:periplasmic heavy metal sensor [Halioglobus sp.]
MNPVKLLFTALALSLAASVAVGQNMKPNGDNRELLRMGLYPPDILMRHQEEIGITTEQRKAIAGLVRDFQGEITELQWAMPSEQQKLRKLLNEDRVDATAALAQVEQVLGMESEFKMAHFELLIAIKNELTTQQIGEINEMVRRRLGKAR